GFSGPRFPGPGAFGGGPGRFDRGMPGPVQRGFGSPPFRGDWRGDRVTGRGAGGRTVRPVPPRRFDGRGGPRGGVTLRAIPPR
ncbi:MAG: hypothetical protein ACK5A1_03680, partial [Planctomyces sp.]